MTTVTIAIFHDTSISCSSNTKKMNQISMWMSVHDLKNHYLNF